MKTIRVDGATFPVDDANADAIQTATAVAIDKARADAAALVTAEKARADKATADLATATKRADGLLARGKALITTARKRIDAMKAKMIGCDECGGVGKVAGDGAEMAKCDYCDGKGMLRMHDAIKAMAPPPDGEPEVADDLEAMGEEMPEDAMETPDAPGVTKPITKGNLDARKAMQAKRKASMDRTADRRAVTRAALLDAARPHVDAADLTKSDIEIKRAFGAKIDAPAGDWSKMDAATVETLYTAARRRLDANGAAPSIALSQGLAPVAPRRDAATSGDLSKFMQAHDKANSPWALPAGKQ